MGLWKDRFWHVSTEHCAATPRRKLGLDRAYADIAVTSFVTRMDSLVVLNDERLKILAACYTSVVALAN